MHSDLTGMMVDSAAVTSSRVRQEVKFEATLDGDLKCLTCAIVRELPTIRDFAAARAAAVIHMTQVHGAVAERLAITWMSQSLDGPRVQAFTISETEPESGCEPVSEAEPVAPPNRWKVAGTDWHRRLKSDLESGNLSIPRDPLLGIDLASPDRGDAMAYAVYMNGVRVGKMSNVRVNVRKQEVKKATLLTRTLRRMITGLRTAIFGYDPATILSQLEGIYAMQKETADALNRLGAEVNSYTSDVAAFVAHSNGVIAEKTASITDLTTKLEAAIANGTGTQEAIADLKEATSDIDAQTERLAEAHKSLTNFTIPPVVADTPAPPVVTAPVIDPTADTIPAQPPVADGTAGPQAQANTGTAGTGSTPAPGEPQQ